MKHSSILRAPETLLVHLKKFRFNGTSSSKMKQAVSYPMFLDLTEYCESKELPVKYQLLSVVVHEGRSFLQVTTLPTASNQTVAGPLTTTSILI